MRETMTMKQFLIGTCVICLIAARAATKPELEKIPVFVTSIGATNEFTDPNSGNVDSVKDLQRHIFDSKNLRLSRTREDATIQLIVTRREKAQVTAGFGGPARDCIVYVKFLFRDTETELFGSAQGGTVASGGAWDRAAWKIVKQVDAWVVTNRARLSQAKP